MNPGDLVQERYRVLEPLGTGGVGAVYRVEHMAMGKSMAMKVLQPELTHLPTVKERFEREARSSAKLDHENIVRVIDYGQTTEGASFLVMELLQGPTLSAHLKEAKQLPVDEAIELVLQILAGLNHAHRNGVIHRDLKPENIILVEKDGRTVLKLLDFGLAKLTEKVPEGPTLTQAGMVFGTPRYMSPEQAASEPTDARSDLYAIGVMLYELLTGEPPLTGATTVEILTAHLTRAPPKLEIADPRCEALDGVLQTALAKSKDDRFPSAEAFAAALQPQALNTPGAFSQTAIKEVPIKIEPAEAPAEAKLQTVLPEAPPRSKKVWWAAAGICALGLLGAVALRPKGAAEGPKAQVELALRQGNAAAAQAALGKLPEGAQARWLKGHLALLQSEDSQALKYYRAVLNEAPSLGADPLWSELFLSAAPRESIRPIMKYVAKKGPPQTVSFLRTLFEKGPDAWFRRRAYAGLVRLDVVEQLQDPLPVLIQDLAAVGTERCSLRKWYVEQIKRFADPRVRTALQKEKKRGGGFMGINLANRCMGKLLDSP